MSPYITCALQGASDFNTPHPVWKGSSGTVGKGSVELSAVNSWLMAKRVLYNRIIEAVKSRVSPEWEIWTARNPRKGCTGPNWRCGNAARERRWDTQGYAERAVR